MNLKNWVLKRKQLKAIQKEDEGSFQVFLQMPYKCPACHWRTDELTAYVTHLEGHLIKKKKRP